MASESITTANIFLYCPAYIVKDTTSTIETAPVTELRNITDMENISVQKYWKVGGKSVGEHAVMYLDKLYHIT